MRSAISINFHRCRANFGRIWPRSGPNLAQLGPNVAKEHATTVSGPAVPYEMQWARAHKARIAARAAARNSATPGGMPPHARAEG